MTVIFVVSLCLATAGVISFGLAHFKPTWVKRLIDSYQAWLNRL
jgi:hypothetical protein